MAEKKRLPSHKPATTGIWVVFDKIIDITAYMSCLALALISFIVTADVLMRYMFRKPFGFTTPLAEFILVCVLAFGGTYLLREQDFIRVDIVVQFLPKKTRYIIRVIFDFISGVIFFLIFCGAAPKCVELIQDKAIIINSGGNWYHAVYAAPMVVFYLLVSIQFMRGAYQTACMIKLGQYQSDHLGGELTLAEILESEKEEKEKTI